MSGAEGNSARGRGSFASRKARGEQGGTSSASGLRGEKAHGFDARLYHQNANRHRIQALRTFDCPVCDSKNTIRVDLHPRQREGTVRCTYCMALRPVPEDLPYPYTTPFVPNLQNKADVFFKFSEMYKALLRQQTSGGEGGPTGSSLQHLNTQQEQETRKRPREEQDGNDSSRKGGDEDGLLGGLQFYPADPEGTEGGLLPSSHFLEDGDGAETLFSTAVALEDDEDDKYNSDGANEPASAAPPADGEGGEGKDGDVGIDEVDVADFFADSD